MILWHLFFLVERDRYIRNLNRFQMSFQEANLDLYSYNIGNEDEECREQALCKTGNFFQILFQLSTTYLLPLLKYTLLRMTLISVAFKSPSQPLLILGAWPHSSVQKWVEGKLNRVILGKFSSFLAENLCLQPIFSWNCSTTTSQ